MREKKKECVVLDEGQMDAFATSKFSQACLTINTTLSDMRSMKTAVEREEMVNEFKRVTQLVKVKGVQTDQNPALQKWALDLARRMKERTTHLDATPALHQPKLPASFEATHTLLASKEESDMDELSGDEHPLESLTIEQLQLRIERNTFAISNSKPRIGMFFNNSYLSMINC